MATVAHIPVRWVTRFPLRPARSGNPRRKPKGASCPSRSEAQGGPRRQARSLDTSKVVTLATSCADHLQETETALDKWNNKRLKQAVLVGSVEKIVRSIEETLANPDLPADRLRAERSRLKLRAREHDRLAGCQSQWIAFHSECCDTNLAVPIGCNHRLCFYCNSHRAEKNRDRVRVLFDRLTHPVFLTLTIPNLPRISKHTFSVFRQRWNKLRGSKRLAHREWMKGGLFAFETTYNNQPHSPAFKTWHVHAHVLIDSAFVIPQCRCSECERCGKWRRGATCSCGGKTGWSWRFDEYRRKFVHDEHSPCCEFIRFKRRLEFDWLCLTQGKGPATGRWRPSDFDYWFNQTWKRAWIGCESRRYEWNCHSRRTVDVRRVTDRQNAAFEILKYATKASVFAYIPEAVDQFMTAVRGARMLQPFGSWYGFDFEDDVNTWRHLECACGEKKFRKVGFLTLKDVFMDESGRWQPKPKIAQCFTAMCRGGP